MKVELTCIYETKKATHQPGDKPDLPKKEAERLLDIGFAKKIENRAKPKQDGDGGENSDDGKGAPGKSNSTVEV